MLGHYHLCQPMYATIFVTKHKTLRYTIVKTKTVGLLLFLLWMVQLPVTPYNILLGPSALTNKSLV